MEMKDIIARIGYFRVKQNLSARELSVRIGKSKNYINRLESTNFNLPTCVLLEIIEALGISPEEFFSSNYTTYKLDNELSQLLKTLPTSKKESLMDFIKK